MRLSMGINTTEVKSVLIDDGQTNYPDGACRPAVVASASGLAGAGARRLVANDRHP